MLMNRFFVSSLITLLTALVVTVLIFVYIQYVIQRSSTSATVVPFEDESAIRASAEI